MKYAAIIPFFLLIIQLVTVSASLFAPTWMKTSSYAEYEIKIPIFRFLNGTMSPPSEEGTSAIFRWECIELNDTMAKLEVSLDSGERDGGVHLSSAIYVDTISRSVFLLNGTLVGTTRLWFPAAPTQGQEIILWELSSDKIVGVANTGTASEPMFFSTIQGVQRVFFVNGNGTINGQKIIFIPFTVDFDTGIMILGQFNNDAALLALGIKQVIGSAQLVGTNIDLGARELSYDIRAALPFIAVIVALIIVFVAVYVRLRKRKH